VLTNATTHKKKIIFHPKLMPAITICDPALTVGMPKFITAGTGMDALAHCLEAYCSPIYHPMSQGIAVEGMRLVFENLASAYKDPTNLQARAHMMSAAAMGADSARSTRSAIPLARSTAPIMAPPMPWSCRWCWTSTARP